MRCSLPCPPLFLIGFKSSYSPNFDFNLIYLDFFFVATFDSSKIYVLGTKSTSSLHLQLSYHTSLTPWDSQLYSQPLTTAAYSTQSFHTPAIITTAYFATSPRQLQHTTLPPTSTTPFKVEYHIQPTQKLKKSQGLIQSGKETLVHSFIVNWDNETHRWIVEVTGLSIATGHQAPLKKRPTAGTRVTPTGRVRPAKHIPSSSPIKPTLTADTELSSDKNKTRPSTCNETPMDGNNPLNPAANRTKPGAGPSTPRAVELLRSLA
ncbi:hypothetical protein DFH28DRAFT_939951 [Melampsora americana]|nr:hypothetical protein DFH28DRAFT_939951 [Melampsora americana]